MGHQVRQMKAAWEGRGIQSHFPKAHHFANSKFERNPPSLVGFCNYCEGKEIQEENRQTVARAMEVVRLFDLDADVEEAIRQAWVKYPVLKR